jgi:hypothetical protein
MIQCIICEDWLHASHLDATVPTNEQYSEMICKGCMEKNNFLHDYTDIAVFNETCEIDIMNVSSIDQSSLNLTNEINETQNEKLTNGAIKTSEKDSKESSEVDSKETENTDTKAVENVPENISMDAEDMIEDTSVEQTTNSTAEVTEQTEIKSDAVENNDLSVEIENKVEEKELLDSCPPVDSIHPEDSVSTTDAKDCDLEPDKETASELENDKSIEEPESTSNVNGNAQHSEISNEGSESITDSKTSDAQITEMENESSMEYVDAVPVEKDIADVSSTAIENKDSNEETKTVEINIAEVINKEEKGTNSESNTRNSVEMDSSATNTEQIIEETQVAAKDNIENDESINETTDTPNDVEMSDDKESVENDKEFVENVKEFVENDKEFVENDKEFVENDKESVENDKQSKQNSTDVHSSLENDQESKLIEDSNSQTSKQENKRKLSTEESNTEVCTKKLKLGNKKSCSRPEGVRKRFGGATFWPSNFRQKLCTCNECITMYKDLSVLFLIDLEDTVTAYEALGKERIDGTVSQYEKGLEALSSLDRIQQINALTEYNKMRDKLLDFLKSFKDRKEIVKEEDIKAFFAGMKPKREPDGVYFCR